MSATQEIELAEAQRREREIESGEVRPLAEAEFWQRVEECRREK